MKKIAVIFVLSVISIFIFSLILFEKNTKMIGCFVKKAEDVCSGHEIDSSSVIFGKENAAEAELQLGKEAQKRYDEMGEGKFGGINIATEENHLFHLVNSNGTYKIKHFEFNIMSYSTKAEQKVNNVDEIQMPLTGNVEMMHFYGPPNYGETPEIDIVETYPILVLHKPLVITINEKAVRISSIQIIRDKKSRLHSFTAGRQYVIEGDVFLAQTGHHHTELVLYASSIRAN